MRTTNFDLLATAAPLDKTASVVRDGSGEHWDPEVKHTYLHWTIRPPLRPIPDATRASPSFVDVTGLRKGRLVAYGLLDYAAAGLPHAKGGKASWVCRCDCGEYEGRTYRALTNPVNSDDMCGKCAKLRSLQHHASRPNTSKRRDEDAKRLGRLVRRA